MRSALGTWMLYFGSLVANLWPGSIGLVRSEAMSFQSEAEGGGEVRSSFECLGGIAVTVATPCGPPWSGQG